MSKKLVFSLAAGALALTAAIGAAQAEPPNRGAVFTAPTVQSLAVPVRFGGGHGGGGFGGGGGFHGGMVHGGGIYAGGFHGQFHGSHFASHPSFHGHAIARSHFAPGHHFHRGHGHFHHGHGHGHHHRHRFFIGGYPYFYYDDGYYDDDYGDNCWWSRRHHRWVCPDY